MSVAIMECYLLFYLSKQLSYVTMVKFTWYYFLQLWLYLDKMYTIFSQVWTCFLTYCSCSVNLISEKIWTLFLNYELCTYYSQVWHNESIGVNLGTFLCVVLLKEWLPFPPLFLSVWVFSESDAAACSFRHLGCMFSRMVYTESFRLKSECNIIS